MLTFSIGLRKGDMVKEDEDPSEDFVLFGVNATSRGSSVWPKYKLSDIYVMITQS